MKISHEQRRLALFHHAELDFGGGKIVRYKQLARLSDTQYRTAKSLIQNICCNYDGGGCLLLDGETCPQTISQSLCCKYFRDVLLEDSQGRDLKAEIMGDDHIRECAACGKPFRAVSNRAKYCKRCAAVVRKKQEAERQRKRYHDSTHLET